MNAKRARIAIADDHGLMRQGLAAILAADPRFEVVGEADDGYGLQEVVAQTNPDVVLMDLRLPGLSGVEAILAIRQEHAEARVIVVTTYDADEDIYRAIQSGAKSYLMKDSSKAEIVGTIRAVHAGQERLPANIADRLAERRRRPELTLREVEVLQLVAKGRSNKEIASGLSIAEDTVKSHLKTLFVKLGVQDRTAAEISAIQHGIVRLD